MCVFRDKNELVSLIVGQLEEKLEKTYALIKGKSTPKSKMLCFYREKVS